jgi:hypothetical protein
MSLTLQANGSYEPRNGCHPEGSDRRYTGIASFRHHRPAGRQAGSSVVKVSCLIAVVMILALAARAETLQGTVTNGTNGKPDAGDEVTLISLGQGMSETAHVRTDSSGRFQFTYSDTGMPHLVRATHQGVGYFHMAPPGTTSVEIQTFDVAKRLEGISTTAEVVRFQSDGSNLQASELFSVQNASQPPRTLAEERSYEIALPEGAVVDEAGARAPNGQPINTMPDAVPGQPYHYVYSFPLRPGETQFEISYHLPYTSSHTVVNATLVHGMQHYVAVLPNSMQFSATGINFAPLEGQKDANVQVASNPQAGDRFAMTISGTGVLADEGGTDSAAPAAGAQMGQGPGGGLGKPIDSPDPISNYRWPLLGGLAVLLIAGGFYVTSNRSSTVAMAAAAEAAYSPAVAKAQPSAVVPAALLTALKEELFQLEVDRQQGRLSEEEYKQTKAGLDLALKRAVSRL